MFFSDTIGIKILQMYSMEPEQWRTQYDDILAEEEQNLAAH